MTSPLSLVGKRAELTGLRNVLWAARFYAGLPPASPDDVPTGLLLGEVVLATPSGVVALPAVLEITCPQTAPAAASGLVGWVRFVSAAGDGLLDVRAGLAAAGYPAVVNVVQVYAGGELQLISCTLAK